LHTVQQGVCAARQETIEKITPAVRSRLRCLWAQPASLPLAACPCCSSWCASANPNPSWFASLLSGAVFTIGVQQAVTKGQRQWQIAQPIQTTNSSERGQEMAVSSSNQTRADIVQTCAYRLNPTRSRQIRVNASKALAAGDQFDPPLTADNPGLLFAGAHCCKIPL